MQRNKSGLAPIMIAVIVIIIVVVGVVLYLVFSPKGEQPKLQITDCSLGQSSIDVHSSTTLKIGIRNNDINSSHTLRVVLNTTKMDFSLGTSNLPKENGFQFFSKTYSPSDQLTTTLTVYPTIPDEAETVTWRLILDFYIDGSKYDSRTLTLKVDR